jgi:hypothetical protein
MLKKIIVPIAVAGALIPVSSQAAKPAPLSGLALQQIQAKDFETTAAIAFPAVMTVLQDAGYRIESANKDTGLITGTASIASHLIWAPFAGFRNKKQVPIVSVFIEQKGPNLTRVRFNYVMSTGKSNKAFTDEIPIEDPAVYRESFERVEKEIFLRQAMSAPAPAARPDVQVATPVAPSIAVTVAPTPPFKETTGTPTDKKTGASTP